VAQNNGNDYALFRSREMVFIKAEAELNGATGTSTAGAGAAGARVRDRHAHRSHAPDILRQRLFEFTNEAKRRQDLIRFGGYTAAWQFKPATGDHYVLMPIPQGRSTPIRS
jgi:hypothetical protein